MVSSTFGHTATESRSKVLERMAIKAEREGVKIAKLAGSNDWVALSTGKTATAYTVRPGNQANGCTCNGYRQHGYCKHYAAVLVAARIMPKPTAEAIAADAAATAAKAAKALAPAKAEPNPFQCKECRIICDYPLTFGVCNECHEEHMKIVDALRGYTLAQDENDEMYFDHWSDQVDQDFPI